MSTTVARAKRRAATTPRRRCRRRLEKFSHRRAGGPQNPRCGKID
jgi:hypothetical protein